MSATWRKERSTVETNEIMKTAVHRSESWCWRQLLSLLTRVLMLVLTQLVSGCPYSHTSQLSETTYYPVEIQTSRGCWDWPWVWVFNFSRCYVRSEVLTAVFTRSSVFWDITPCSPLKVNQCFGRTCRLHLQCRWMSRARTRVISQSTELLFSWYCLVVVVFWVYTV
jgi:hypothetical protein